MMRIFFLLLVLFVVVFSARAHEADTRHVLLLQVEQEAVLVLVVYEVPAGRSASVLRAMFSPSAAFSESQRAALAQKLATDAVAGWSIEQGGKPLAAESLDWKLDIDESRPDGGLLLALKIELSGGGAGRYEVLSPSQHASALSLEVEVVLPLSAASAFAPLADPQALGPWVLRAGDRLWFSVQ